MEKNRYNVYLDPEFSAVMDYKAQDTLPFPTLWVKYAMKQHHRLNSQAQGDQIL